MLPDFSQPLNFLLLTAIIFIVITVRYFMIAGIFYAIFYRWSHKKWSHRKISQRDYASGQFRKEIRYSIVSSFIFAVFGAVAFVLWQKGFTKVYLDFSAFPIWYIPLSLIIYMLVQETYYYWIHRWMHIPKIFRLVHKVHHDSRIASPFTAFSFHPIEATLQAILLPLMILFIPIHLYVLIFLLVIMSVSSVINHLDIELYPAGWRKSFSRFVIGATHHSLHHKYYKYNFGLYFTFWDVWKKTENDRFDDLYKKLTADRSNEIEGIP